MRNLMIGILLLSGALVAPAVAQTTVPPTAPASTQPTEYVRTYFLTHASAQEMLQVLVQLFQSTPGPRPVVTTMRNTNALTIRGTEATLRAAEDVIKQLDVPQAAPSPTTVTPQPTPPAQAPSVSQQRRLPGLPELPAATNIQLELTITDTMGGTPTTKKVSMIILNSSNGMIRTTAADNSHWLNVDAMATAYQTGLIGVRLSFEYTPPPTGTEGRSDSRAPRLNESLTVVVVAGKPLVISQSADAASDRTVTASITATVVKY